MAEQVCKRIACEAGPGVGNGNFDHIICGPGVRDNQLTVRRGGHRLQRIAEQVDQDLLNLDPVGKHQVVRRVQVEAQKYSLLAGAGEPERAGLLDHF